MPLIVKILPSRYFSILLFLVYTLSISIIFILPVLWWLKVVFITLLSGMLIYYFSKYAGLIYPSSIVALTLDQGEVLLIQRDGSVLPGVVLGTTLVTPALIILNITLKDSARGKSVVIFPDGMERERFRALRVKLKWE